MRVLEWTLPGSHFRFLVAFGASGNDFPVIEFISDTNQLL